MSAIRRGSAFDDGLFKVVVNHEEQYAIWPADVPTPDGWRETGTSAQREVCLKYIRMVWTDMRPLSAR